MIRMSMMIPCAGAIARLRPDGIAEVRVADDHICSLEEVQEVARVISVLGNRLPLPLLRIAGKFSDVEDGVREFMATDAWQNRIMAEAIVIHSLPQRILWNFYLKMNRPKKPTFIFTNENEAVAWLRQFTVSLN